jgi:hypothetical protein
VKTIRFTNHALERAVHRFFPGETLDAAEAKLSVAWNDSPAKLKDAGRFEERWLLSDPPAILVCAIEGGERIVKTVLRTGRAAEELDLEPDTIPAPSPQGKLIITLEVDYLINDAEASHAEVQTLFENIAAKGFKGSVNSKKITILNAKSSSRSSSVSSSSANKVRDSRHD